MIDSLQYDITTRQQAIEKSNRDFYETADFCEYGGKKFHRVDNVCQACELCEVHCVCPCSECGEKKEACEC